AGCVPGCVYGDDPSRDLLSGLYTCCAGFDGLEDASCACCYRFDWPRKPCGLTQGPEFELPSPNHVLCPWVSQAVVQVIDQTPEVIRVRMSQHNLANLLRLYASSLQAVGEIARCLFPGAAGTGVYENVIVSRSHEGNI